MPKQPIVVSIDCKDPAEAAAVQQMLTDLAGHNGATGLLNLKKRMDGNMLIRNQVINTLNGK